MVMEKTGALAFFMRASKLSAQRFRHVAIM
jgi:hypothetical protein